MANQNNNSKVTTSQSTRLETRTRDGNITDSLRFRVHDALWLLTRQWQLGEFKGNDAGTAVAVKCSACQTKMSNPVKDGGDTGEDLCQYPIEPQIEELRHDMTPMVSVESAMHYMAILKNGCARKNWQKNCVS